MKKGKKEINTDLIPLDTWNKSFQKDPVSLKDIQTESLKKNTSKASTLEDGDSDN